MIERASRGSAIQYPDRDPTVVMGSREPRADHELRPIVPATTSITRIRAGPLTRVRSCTLRRRSRKAEPIPGRPNALLADRSRVVSRRRLDRAAAQRQRHGEYLGHPDRRWRVSSGPGFRATPNRDRSSGVLVQRRQVRLRRPCRERRGCRPPRGYRFSQVTVSKNSWNLTRQCPRSVRRGQPRELALQYVDLCEIAVDVVIAASLAASEPETAARVRVAGAATTQVDDRCEVRPLRQRGGEDAVALKGSRDRAIQHRGGHLYRMTGHHARVERVEPTRSRIVPGTVLDNEVAVDAVASGLREHSVGDLKHPDGARSRSVPLEWVPAESPPPVRLSHRIAAALNLG